MADLVNSPAKIGASEIMLLFAYPEYVLDFSMINKDTISLVKDMDTLVSLLKRDNTDDQEWPEENHIKKLKLWWQLVRSLESKIISLSSKVVIPMLESCCRVTAASGNYKSFKKLTFEVIARLLETRADMERVMDNNKEWESYQWVLEPLADEVLWDHHTATALLNAFSHLISIAKKDIKVCVLVRISQQLVATLKDCYDMELYITFLNCFECLVVIKKLKEEAFVNLAVSSSFMMQNALFLLSETVDNQNEQRSLQCEVVNMLLNLFTQLFEHIVTHKMASFCFENLVPSFVFMLKTAVENVLPSFTSKLIRFCQKLCECIQRVYGQSCSLQDLKIFFPLMELTLPHSNRHIKKCSKKLWESTFSHLPESVYPESLKLILTGSSSSNSKISDQEQHDDEANEHAQSNSKEQSSVCEIETSLLEKLNIKNCKVTVYKLPAILQANETNTLLQEDFIIPITELSSDTVVEAIIKKMVEEKASKKRQEEINQAEAELSIPDHKEERNEIKCESNQAEAKFPDYKVKVEGKHKIKTETIQIEAQLSVTDYKVRAEEKNKIQAEYLSCMNVVTRTEQILEFLSMDQLLELNAKLNSLVSQSIKVILVKKKDNRNE